MSEIRFKWLLCIGYVGENEFIRSLNGGDIFPEIVQYFYQKYKGKPGSVIFFNKSGGLVIKQLRDLTIGEMEYYGII